MLFHPAHYYYSAGNWLWSIFSMLLFIAFVVFAIILLVRAISGPRHGVTGPGMGSISAIRRPHGTSSRYGLAGVPCASAASAGSGASVVPGTFVASGMTTGAATDAAQGGQGEAFGAARILAERYARGEISEQEFRERTEVLRQTIAGWRAADGQDQVAAQQPHQQSAQNQPLQRQPPPNQPPPDQPPPGHQMQEQPSQEHPSPAQPPAAEPRPPRPPSVD